MTLQLVTLLLPLYAISASTNRGLLSTVDKSVMTINMNLVDGNNWKIGTTLDGFFRSGYASPFTTASVAAFEAIWGNKEVEGVDQFSFQTQIMSTRDEQIDFLDVGGSLTVSFAMFSGEAHMQFLKENSHSSSDVSVMVKASSSGRKKQLSGADTNVLKLKNSSVLTLDDFLLQHGHYLIVGFTYGGEILYECTHSAKSAVDKMKIEGGLKLSFKQGAFEIGGSANVDWKKEDIQKAIAHSDMYSVRPSIVGEDMDNLIATLQALSFGDAADDASQYTTLSQSAQRLLSGDNIGAIQAVVVPLSSVSAVHDRYVDNPDMEDTAAFYEFLNEVTLEIMGLEKQLKMVQAYWTKSKNFRQQVWPKDEARMAWIQWDHRFTLFNEEMSTLNTIEEIVLKSKEFSEILPLKDPFADVLTAETFLDITALSMRYQFESDIMEPFWEMVAATTSNPTMDPTNTPTSAPSPAPSPAPSMIPTASPTTSEPTSTLQPTASPSTPWPTALPTTSAGSHWIAAGDVTVPSWGSGGIPNVECMLNVNRHSTAEPGFGTDIAVSCCAEDESVPRMMNGECLQAKTYYEANAICTENGYRLCTLSEMLEGRTKDKGCGHDHRYNWVQDECDGEESAHYVYQGNPDRSDWGSDPDYYCQSDSNDQAAYYSIDFDLDIAASCCSDNDLSDVRYMYPPITTTWESAAKYCQIKYGTSLATIRDADDWKRLKEEILVPDSYWIGLNDLSSEGQWQWESGYECDGGNCDKLAWWDDGEPNNHGVGEDCASIRLGNTVSHHINDWKCNNGAPFICDAPTMTDPAGHRPDCGAHPKTYEEAEDFCYSRGHRLCTVKEMEMGVMVDNGCSYDAGYTWVSDPCSITISQPSAAAHVGIAPFDGTGPVDNAVYVLSARDLIIIVLIATSLVSMITLIVVCQRRSARSAKYKAVGIDSAIESDSEMEQLERA